MKYDDRILKHNTLWQKNLDECIYILEGKKLLWAKDFIPSKTDFRKFDYWNLGNIVSLSLSRLI